MKAADNAVESASRGYRFAPGSYTYEALSDAMTVRDMLAELSRRIAEVAP